MRTLGLVSLSLASCIFFFTACESSDDSTTPGPDGGGTSSGGTSGGGTSSGGTSSGGTSGGPGDDDDVAPDPDAGADSGDAGPPPPPDTRPPSCKGSTGAGITTCGKDEAATDDCCTSLTLPKTKTRTLDKYEVTAGRMRRFIEANPNVRQFAKDFATAHPSSQLGSIAKSFPAKGEFGAYLDVLPNGPPNGGESLDETLALGGFPQDAMNYEDGCAIAATGKFGYGAATYWQDPKDLKVYKLGNKKDGVRNFSKDELDKKALNCVSALMYAAFCAWDGGELARTSDYYEVWRHDQVPASAATGAAKVTIPWTDVLPWGQFNWRNGHNGACPKGWPGCEADPPIFYSFPTPNTTPQDDDSPEVAAPGRFPKDVTKAVSGDGSGWFDLGGNLMDQAWPNTKLVPDTQGFCETAAGSGGATATTKCDRDQPKTADHDADPRPGTFRFKGNVPPVVLVGSSFEVHFNRAQAYFASATDDESKIVAGDIKPMHFQYGKIGGRCARVK